MAKVTCKKYDCFGNNCGKCMVLVDYTKRQKRGLGCSFYKSAEALRKQDKRLYRKIIHEIHEERSGC